MSVSNAMGALSRGRLQKLAEKFKKMVKSQKTVSQSRASLHTKWFSQESQSRQQRGF
jgi:hypothetical protein